MLGLNFHGWDRPSARKLNGLDEAIDVWALLMGMDSIDLAFMYNTVKAQSVPPIDRRTGCFCSDHVDELASTDIQKAIKKTKYQEKEKSKKQINFCVRS